jgi:hypothetical protein
MPPVLETARPILRPLELADAHQTQALFPHWEIVRFLNASVPWPYPANGAFHLLSRCSPARNCAREGVALDSSIKAIARAAHWRDLLEQERRYVRWRFITHRDSDWLVAPRRFSGARSVH